MADANQHYPDTLNPFGSDEEDEKERKAGAIVRGDDYPDYLSPFGDDDNGAIDDYDSSLNPFGEEEETPTKHVTSIMSTTTPSKNQPDRYNNNTEVDDDLGEGNPFAEKEEENESPAPLPLKIHNLQQNAPVTSSSSPDKNEASRDDINHVSSTSKPSSEHQTSAAYTPQPESLEAPPVPLPRTKSLLKKEQKMRQQQQLVLEQTNQASSLSTTSSNSLSSINTATTTTIMTQNTSNNSQALTAINSTGSFQRRKNKRNAPPVPINFKRQVSGSLDAIEEELNDIGDKLAIIEKESNVCQETLKSSEDVDGQEFAMTRNKFIELIKRKNSIVRRQKELMYRKRELNLDQLHSDIEYELRMIGNKQLSHRTLEDEAREKELLKKLVEIVEEKNDIVENLNKDSSCDSHDIEKALRRLNITAPSKSQPQKSNDGEEVKKSSKLTKDNLLTKKRDCDKSSIAKLSKIATLLPNGGTIKGTIKLKRKQLFKKSCDSRPVEHK